MIESWKALFVFAASLLVGCERSLGEATNAYVGATNAYAGISSNAFIIKFEYVGGETRGWHQVCLANQAGTNELTAWLDSHRFLWPKFCGAIITEEEVAKMRLVLNQPPLSKKRGISGETRPENIPRYRLHVWDKGEEYFVGLGYDSNTLQVISQFKFQVSNAAAEQLSFITNEIAFLRQRFY